MQWVNVEEKAAVAHGEVLLEYSREDLNETADVSKPLMLLPELEPLLYHTLHSINREVLLYRRKLRVHIASCEPCMNYGI
jgi:hypothetical protein